MVDISYARLFQVFKPPSNTISPSPLSTQNQQSSTDIWHAMCAVVKSTCSIANIDGAQVSSVGAAKQAEQINSSNSPVLQYCGGALSLEMQPLKLLKPSLHGLIFVSEVEVGGATPKRRTVRKFAVRGVNMDQLLDMGTNELVKLFHCMLIVMFLRFEEETHGSY
ncbi:hypothetical protein IFM89_020398 [Coptis chinensis]|uniref:Uncharacterized protein n=1 Tax=Coptis chinensis TaxID=261450 RepID=A0A835LWK6_9MAGN|nr:hypothetical protein IFM89_020398 [Coptis chinensis]